MAEEGQRNFAHNLREACSTRTSISEVCREIGFNRQQFNRYINGQALPSAHNRLRIAQFFDIPPEDFELPREAFRKRLAPRSRHDDPDTLMEAYPGDLSVLQRYLGFYQSYHLSMSWRGRVVCGCAHLRIRDAQVRVTSRERITEAETGISMHSRYIGLVSCQRDRIFITERTTGENTTLGHTILMPFELHQRLYLRGVTMGVSWRTQNMPYAARTIWRYFGQDADRRALLARCGVYRLDEGSLPAPVRRYLSSSESRLVTVPPAADDDG
jgi:transcriptional regulator with XRE-family HTH domain